MPCMHISVSVCANVLTCGSQSKTLGIFLYASSYCIEKGSFTEVESRRFGQMTAQ